VEKLLQKRLLAVGCGLFLDTIILYSNLRWLEGWLFKGYGCLFLTGDFTCMYQCRIVFSDFTFVFETCHNISSLIDDGGTDNGFWRVDVYQPQAV
jgi:hypothetical protein